jgi:hypothetical protein
MSQRQHRLLAIFAALQAWQRGLDCIHIDRGPLCKYLGVERLTADRAASLAYDFKPWFPYYDRYAASDYGEREHTLSFSRIPLAELWPRTGDDPLAPPASRERRAGTLNIPKDGLTEPAIWGCLMGLLLGFSEPQGDCGFNQLERPNPFADFQKYVDEIMRDPARYGLPVPPKSDAKGA